MPHSHGIAHQETRDRPGRRYGGSTGIVKDALSGFIPGAGGNKTDGVSRGRGGASRFRAPLHGGLSARAHRKAAISEVLP